MESTIPTSGTAFSPSGRVRPAVLTKARVFPLSAVRITGGPFRRALDVNRAYLVQLDPDRLLHHLRKNAGLEPKAPPYLGWDKDSASTAGHYLSACAQMAAAGDALLRKRADYMVAEMAACQKAVGDGGLYPFSWDRTDYFAKMRRGELLRPGVSPWYLLHKVMAGLRDAYVQIGNRQALDVLVRHANWCADVTAKLTPEQWQQMLDAEHGGPHEILADVYALTGEPRFRTLAEKFRHHRVYDPLAKNDDAVLNGLHANTQVPKFIGYARFAELNGSKADYEAARNFHRAVALRRSWANGGNSQWEAFFDPKQSEQKLTEVCGPETCNSYNMLKLTEQLYTREPSASYLDYYERVLYNHILPAIAPEPGGYVYYTPMRPGHYRVFSRSEDAFWCCVGTGLENPTKYGEMIYAHGAGRLYVNLFVPSVLTWKEQGLTLRQETRFPEEDRTRLTLNVSRPWKQIVSLRCPAWVPPGQMQVRVNGAVQPVRATPEGYVNLTRVWKSGDRIEVRLPMRLRVEPLANSNRYVSLHYGPILLAGALGTDDLKRTDFYGGGPPPSAGQTAKKAEPLYEAPFIEGSAKDVIAKIAPTAKPLTFRTRDLMRPADVTLMPLYQLPYQRYSVYWHLADAATSRALLAERNMREAEARRLAETTLDRVRVGNTESESAHKLAAEESYTGASPITTHYPMWRDAKGFIRYELAVKPDAPSGLHCVYWGSDSGRTFDILVDGTRIATETLTGKKPGDFLPVTYSIPPALTAGKTTVAVEFRPAARSTAGGIFDVRTVRL